MNNEALLEILPKPKFIFMPEVAPNIQFINDFFDKYFQFKPFKIEAVYLEGISVECPNSEWAFSNNERLAWVLNYRRKDYSPWSEGACWWDWIQICVDAETGLIIAAHIFDCGSPSGVPYMLRIPSKFRGHP